MAEQTFTAGQVLTAAQMTTLQTNTGLNYITSGTLSGASTNFAGCFTSQYRNYRIVLDSVTFSGISNLWVRLLVGTTPNTSLSYGFAGLGWRIDGAASNYNNTPSYFLVGQGQTNNFSNSYNNTVLDVLQPQEAIRTGILAQTNANEGLYIFRTGGGLFEGTTQFDGIQFLSGSAVTLTGNVTIYGYRK